MLVSECNTEFLTDFKYTDMVLHSRFVRILFEYRQVSINLNLTLNTNVQYLIDNFAAMHIDIADF